MTPVPNLLVVDDDAALRSLLCAYLARFGFAVYAAADGADMQRMLDAHRIDLVVLDRTLPGADGLALGHALRSGPRIPFIMLTARCSPAERIAGLEMGADDFLGKPFEPRELVARIQTVLRRTGVAGVTPLPLRAADVIHFDGWALQRTERCLTSPSGQAVPLSNAEFQLLSTFLRAPRRTVSREQLMAQARDRGMAAVGRSIDLLVSRLRQKLADASGPEALIKTVRGAGYRFDARWVQASGAAPG